MALWKFVGFYCWFVALFWATLAPEKVAAAELEPTITSTPEGADGEEGNTIGVCRICSLENATMTQPNKEVVMPDANASCASIDAYIQEFYQPGSAECLEKQTLEDFCGCQEPVCRVCSSPTATMMLPNKVVPTLGEPTCARVDEFAQQNFEPGSEDCLQVLQLEEYCGCHDLVGAHDDDVVCRLCPYDNFTFNPDPEIQIYDFFPTCRDIDWYTSHFYEPNSSMCWEAQTGLAGLCECQEQDYYQQDFHNNTSLPPREDESSKVRDGCILCPDGNPPKYPDLTVFRDDFGATTCIEFAALVWIAELSESTSCSEYQDLYAEYCCGLEEVEESVSCTWCERGVTKPHAFLTDHPDAERPWTCKDAALVLDLQDFDDFYCSLARQLNFRCGCSDGRGFDHPYVAMTLKQYNLYVWLPRVVGVLSMLGSMYIIICCLVNAKKRIESTKHQILIGMSIVDFLSSFMYVLGPIPAQKEEYGLWYGNPGARGTATTCRVQGFFIQLGLAAIFYNVSLSTYFYLVVRHGWRESRFQAKKVNFILWIAPLALGLALAVMGIDLYQGYQGFCDLAVSELVYYSLQEMDFGYVTQGQTVNFVIIPLAFSIAVLTILMVATYMYVRKIDQRASRWRFSGDLSSAANGSNQTISDDNIRDPNSSGTSQQVSEQMELARINGIPELPSSPSFTSRSSTSSLKDAIFWQSIFYLLGFYITWPLLLVILCLPLEKVTFSMRLLVVTLLPYQGIHNFFVYIRPKIIVHRKKKTRQQEAMAREVQQQHHRQHRQERVADDQSNDDSGKTSESSPQDSDSQNNTSETSPHDSEERETSGCFEGDTTSKAMWSTCASNETIDA